MKYMANWIARLIGPMLHPLRNFLTLILRRAYPEQHPRVYSNYMLRRVGKLLTGDVINVSGWKDGDKEGGLYRQYFPSASLYHVSNFKGARGTDDSGEGTDLFLDLQQALPAELVGRYDVVFNHTTLEHVPNVEIAFDTLCDLTRDVLILVVPFEQEVHFISGSFGDYQRFSPGGVAHQLSKRGLTPLLVEMNETHTFAKYVFCVASKKPLAHSGISQLGSKQWDELVRECLAH